MPWEFRRTTKREDLKHSPAALYKYAEVPGQTGYRRWR